MKRHPHRRSLVPGAVGLALTATLGVAGVAGAATTPGPGSNPGAFGSVAAISGSSMEVQNAQTGQVTVSWTPSTTFSQTVTVSASSMATGDCVTVTGTSSKGTITARSVSVSQPRSGKCTSGAFGGRFGAGRTGGSGGSGGFTPPRGGFRPPSGSSNGAGRTFPGFANMGFASGQVTSVTASTLVINGISSADLRRPTTKPTSSKKSTSTAAKTTKPPRISATTVKIKLASSTTYTQTQTASATALAVGDCVAATGTSSSTGSVSASMVRITSTGGQSCTTGFGGFRAGSFGGRGTTGD
jgi:Domain of unknown function (DUF5666)